MLLCLVCRKCGTPLIKKGIHHNGKQRYKCTECGLKSIDYDIVNYDDIEKTQLQETIDGPNWDIVSTSSEIRTLDQLLKFCNVDLNKWAIKKHTVNSWGSKRNENFQVKAWLSEKLQDINLDDIYKAFDDIAKKSPKYTKINRPDKKFNLMAELNMPDIHFGQLSWGEETGAGNYNIKIAYDRALEAAHYYYNMLKTKEIAKILVIIGNDFFNVNSAANTTQAGTLQAEDDRWKKTFTKGLELWIEIIDLFSEIADIEIKIIPGNHDQERVYYLGESIRAWYSKSSNVEVDNGPKDRKYVEWGKCLLGYTHGNKEVKNFLPQIMATEQPLAWSVTTWREWRTAHLHTTKQLIDEMSGVIMSRVPSIVSLGDWHSGKGYSSTKRALLTLWDKTEGKHSDNYYNIKGNE